MLNFGASKPRVGGGGPGPRAPPGSAPEVTNQLFRYLVFGDSQRRLVGWILAFTGFVWLTPQLSASMERVEQIGFS